VPYFEGPQCHQYRGKSKFMRTAFIALVIAMTSAVGEKLPDGTRWSPETLPDYVEVKVHSRPCDSPAGRGLWMIRVVADTNGHQLENFYLIPYLWDRSTGELLVFSGSLASEPHESVHQIEFGFHPSLLDKVVVSASINGEKHLIIAGDFLSGQRCE